VHGAFADFIVADEESLGRTPNNVNNTEAAAIPLVGITDICSFNKARTVWNGRKNLTVVVTSGSGGTGFLAIQLAKAYGASHVITAASPANFEFLKSLGADTIVDYHKQDIFDYLRNNSVDIVYDNYGKEGSGDRAMHAIRKGGAYLFLPHGGCFTNRSQAWPCVAEHPKEGIENINVITENCFASNAFHILDELKSLFESTHIKVSIQREYSLEKIREAHVLVSQGHVVGKVIVTMKSDETIV